MTCQVVSVPGAGTAIVCGTRARKRCIQCDRVGTLLCDWKMPSRKSGTCDAPICHRCSTSPSMHGRTDFDKDLCPRHAREFEAWKAKRA